MMDNFRHFEVGPDPFGRSWQIEFLWQQNAITIRHSDTVDVKFRVSQDGEHQEKVVAIPHPDLLALSRRLGRPLTDAWVTKLAAIHIRSMIETDTDMEKTIVTISQKDLERHNALLEEWKSEQLLQR
jgi:hypothetical protein